MVMVLNWKDNKIGAKTKRNFGFCSYFFEKELIRIKNTYIIKIGTLYSISYILCSNYRRSYQKCRRSIRISHIWYGMWWKRNTKSNPIWKNKNKLKWLNKLAEAENVNFSKLLQSALKDYLKVKRIIHE